jgi:hypothetical protein
VYLISFVTIACQDFASHAPGDFETSNSKKKFKTAWMEYEHYVKCSRFVSRCGSITKYG